MNGFANTSAQIRLLADRRREELKRFNAQLGEPVVFVPYEDDSGHGVGYFRAGDGVIAYTKYSNGYSPNTRVDFPAHLIDILNTVRMT